jgi:peroxidase
MVLMHVCDRASCAGAHTIGRAHCVSFEERIYPTIDPKMNPAFGQMLRYRCPLQENTSAEQVHFTYFRNDEQSPMLFDNHYYVNLVAKQGLLHINSELFWDARTKPYVLAFAKDNALWHERFAAAFTILSEHQPLTGTQGEVRKECSFVN